MHTEGRDAETPVKPPVSRRQPKSGKPMGRWRGRFHRGIRLQMVTDLASYRGDRRGEPEGGLIIFASNPPSKPGRPSVIALDCADASADAGAMLSVRICVQAKAIGKLAYGHASPATQHRNAHGKNARPNAHAFNQSTIGPLRVRVTQGG
jgi:hypothetical protein